MYLIKSTINCIIKNNTLLKVRMVGYFLRCISILTEQKESKKLSFLSKLSTIKKKK